MFDRSPNIFAGCNAKRVSTNTNAITFVTPDVAPPHCATGDMGNTLDRQHG